MTHLMRFVQNVQRNKNTKVTRDKFEQSENFYGHESVQALWKKDAGEVALNYRI